MIFNLDEIGIPDERDSVNDIGTITIDSDRAIGDIILIMVVREIPGRRKKRFTAESDHINLNSNSSHFGIKFSK